jgi:hypothetical protein
MKIGKLGFELYYSMMRTRDVAGAASACPVALHRRNCSLSYLWVTPHAEIVV